MSAHTTITTAPPLAPPDLYCPSCNAPLRYVRSYVAGPRRSPEQWDAFSCTRTCGDFEFRHRRRSVRLVRAEVESRWA
jgi:hypothetical protein